MENEEKTPELKIVENINKDDVAEVEAPKKMKKPTDKKRRGGIIVFAIGIVALVAGLVFMLLSIFAEPGLRDAEYLVEVGSWVREDEPAVVWNFTEVGKGTLTTNNSTNTYDFIWAIDEDKIKFETSWLYTLNDSFTYELNQGTNTLVLKTEDKELKFIPLETN